MKRHCLAIATLTCFMTSTRAEVLNVRGTEPGAFPTIQSAVDAAHDGDLILIHPLVLPDTYSGFEIVGKSLDIVANGSFVRGSIAISHLAEGQYATLRAITVDFSAPWLTQPLLTVNDTDGVVWIEECDFGSDLYFYNSAPSPPPAILLDNAARVYLSDAEIHGASGGSGAFDVGGAALAANESTVFAFDVTADGGSGDDGAAGGVALALANAEAYIHDSALEGGIGGFAPTSVGGTGGAGIQATGSGALWLIGTDVAGGSGGLGSEFAFGPTGEPLDVTPTIAVHTHSVPSKSLSTPATLPAEIAQWQVVMRGSPGDVVVLFADLAAPSMAFLDALPGTVAVGPSSFLTFAGLQTSSSLTAHFSTPSLPASLSHLGSVFQAAFRNPAGTLSVSNASRIQSLN